MEKVKLDRLYFIDTLQSEYFTFVVNPIVVLLITPVVLIMPLSKIYVIVIVVVILSIVVSTINIPVYSFEYL